MRALRHRDNLYQQSVCRIVHQTYVRYSAVHSCTHRNTCVKQYDFLYTNTKQNEQNEIIPVLYSQKMGFEIDNETFEKIRKYMCFMFDVKLEKEIVKSKSLAAEIIAKERADIAKKNAELKGTTSLIQMISFALNHPGFKYKKDELREVGYVEFVDSIKRLQVYEATKALTQGSYSGFCDMSKIPKEEFNFMRKVT